MSPDNKLPDWYRIAEQASKEQDPEKLSQLVRALCDRLHEAEQKSKERPARKPSPSSGPPPAKPNGL